MEKLRPLLNAVRFRSLERPGSVPSAEKRRLSWPLRGCLFSACLGFLAVRLFGNWHWTQPPRAVSAENLKHGWNHLWSTTRLKLAGVPITTEVQTETISFAFSGRAVRDRTLWCTLLFCEAEQWIFLLDFPTQSIYIYKDVCDTTIVLVLGRPAGTTYCVWPEETARLHVAKKQKTVRKQMRSVTA